MADFIKPSNQILQNKTTTIDTTLVIPNEYGGIYDKPKKRKKDFVESRMNNDNFWNLMFALCFILGMGLIFILAPKAPTPWPTYVSVLFWTILIGVPLFVKRFSKTTFTDGKFFNSEGVELNIPKQLPNGFFLVITTIGIVIVTGGISDSFAKPHSVIVDFIFITTFLIALFFIPVLFFICKNCPISILFNYQFYKQNVKFSSSSSFEDRKSSSYEPTKSSSHSTVSSSVHWSVDPSKYYMPGNAYHNKR